MRLFDNSVDSHYEEQKTLYPVFYRDVLEMDAIWHTVGYFLDRLRSDMIRSLDNSTISRAEAARIAILENWIGIPNNGVRLLSDRRSVLQSFLYGDGHIGQRDIQLLMESFTSGVVKVQLLSEYKTVHLDGKHSLDGSWLLNQFPKQLAGIQILVERDIADKFNLADATLVIAKRIPAHLQIFFVDILRPITIRTANRLRLGQMRFSARAKNSNRIAKADWRFMPCKNTQTFDGSILFDGSRRFDARREEI